MPKLYTKPTPLMPSWAPPLNATLDRFDARLDQTGFNVMEWGAKGDNLNDDTTKIQEAATAVGIFGGVLLFPPGTYVITDKIVIPSKVTVQGAGMNASIIKQTGSNKDGLWSVDGRFITVRDIQILGTGVGTGIGVNMTDSDVPAELISMSNVYVKSWGGDGVYLADPISSYFQNVRAETCGGHGFNVQIGTSLTFTSCYGVSCGQAAFNLKSVSYSSMISCASDSNGMAYLIDGCVGVTLVACGLESPSIATAPYDGQGFKVVGGTGHSFINCYANGPKKIGLWFTGNTTRNSVIDFSEVGGSVAGATASIQVDAGSRARVFSYATTVVPNFAPGSVTVISDNGNIGVGAEAGTSNQVEVRTGGPTNQYVARREVAATDAASFVLSNAGTAMWSATMRGDNTNDFNIRNTNRGFTALLVEERATAPNISLLTGTKDYGGGAGVLYWPNASTAPTANPTAGVILYAAGGRLKIRQPDGTNQFVALTAT